MAQQRNSISIKIQALVDGLESIRKLSAEIEAMGGNTSEASAEIAGLEKELQALERQQGAVDRLNKLNAELTTTESALQQAREEATRLGKEMAQAEKPTKRLTNQFERARKRVIDLKSAYQQQAQGLKAASNSAKAAGLDTKRLVAEQVRLSAKSKQASAAVEKLAGSLKKTKTELKDAGNNAESASKKVGKLSAVMRGFAATLAARFVVKTNADLEGMAKGFELVTGSAEKAAQEMANASV
ncbi:hypothetical protein [Thiolapillus sp.]